MTKNNSFSNSQIGEITVSALQSVPLGNLKSSIYRSPADAWQKSAAANRSARGRKTASDEALIIERLKAGDSDASRNDFQYLLEKTLQCGAADSWRGRRHPGSDPGCLLDGVSQGPIVSRPFAILDLAYRLTVNAALIKLRQRKKNREISFGASLCKFRKDHHRAQPLVDWADTLEDKYARREMQALFCSALQELKPIDKSVAVLSHLQGLSAKEIATTVRLTVLAVKSRLHRARLLLRGRVFQAQSNDNSFYSRRL